MRWIVFLLCSVLTAPEVAAGDPTDTSDLRVRFDDAAGALRKGDTRGARAGFEAVAAALEPAFLAGEFKPNSGDQRWVLYGSSVLMLSDVSRYRLQDPRRARDLEAKLAADAERLGHVDLAAAQWIAVGDIERFDLDDSAAALLAYQRVPGLRGGDLAADGMLVNQALQGTARTRGGRPEVMREARLDVPLSPQHIEAVSVVVPHIPVYATGDAAGAYAAFSKAHPRSFRAAVADYAAFLLALVFRGDPGTIQKTHDAFLQGRPDDVLTVTVCEIMLAHEVRAGKTAAAAEERSRLEVCKRKLGLLPEPTPVTQSGISKTSAFERPASRVVAPDPPGRRQEVC